MARSKMSWEERQELHHILHWIRSPVSEPIDYMVKLSVRDFLDGVDPRTRLINMGIQPFVAERIVYKAQTFLQNERTKRRLRAKEILATRARNSRSFTSENFHVTMDPSQDRNYGMVNISIYCLVEVWMEDETVEHEYLINFSDFKTKEWLTRLLVWGLMNKREILLKPASESVMSSMKMFVPKERAERSVP